MTNPSANEVSAASRSETGPSRPPTLMNTPDHSRAQLLPVCAVLTGAVLLLLNATGLAQTSQTVAWTGGNVFGSWLAPANWNPQTVPIDTPTTVFTVIVPDTASVAYDAALDSTVDALSFGLGSRLRLVSGHALGVNTVALIKGTIDAAGAGSAFIVRTNNCQLTGYPALNARDGAEVTVGASIFNWDRYDGNATLLLALGAGSLVDLSAASSMYVSYGAGGSRSYAVTARTNGVIDLSGLSQVSGPADDDWLDFNIDTGGDIRLDALGRTSGRVRFNVANPTYELPFLNQASDTYFNAATNTLLSLPRLGMLSSAAITIASNALVAAPALLTLDAVDVTVAPGAVFQATNLLAYRNSSIPFQSNRIAQLGPLADIYASRLAAGAGATGRVAAIAYDMYSDWRASFTFFSADGPGALLDLSSLRSITTWGGYGGGWTYSILAGNNGTIDLSGLTTLTGPRTDAYDNNDWLSLTLHNGGNIRLDSLRSITRKTRWYPQVPRFALPALETADNAQFFLSTSGRLDLPVVRSVDSALFALADGSSVNAPQLESLSSSSFDWGFNSTFTAPNLRQFAGSALTLAPGRNLNVPPFTDIYSSRIEVTGGRTFGVAATSYDMYSDWRSSFIVFAADGTGSLLDLASIQTLTAQGGWGGSWTYSILADNNGVVDLSGLDTITGPRTDAYDNNDWLAFTVRNGGAIRLPALHTLTRKTRWFQEIPRFELPALETADNAEFYVPTSGQTDLPSLRNADSTLFGLADGATVNLPQLESLSSSSFNWGFNDTVNAPNLRSFAGSTLTLAPGRTFNAPPFTNIYAARLAVTGGRTLRIAATSYDMYADWRSSFAVFSADGTGSLLDLKSLESITAQGGWGGGWTYSILADNGGTVDLSGLTTVVGPRTDAYDNNDVLTLAAANAGVLRIGNAAVGRNARVSATGLATRLEANNPYLRPPATLAVTAQALLRVTGDFAHECTDPDSVVIENATLQMDGPQPQRFEVAGRNSGPTGFTSRNFGASQIVVGRSNQTSIVRLVDAINNGQRGNGGAAEALYLYGIDGQGLRLLSGSRLVLGALDAYAAINGQMQSLRSRIPAGANSVPFDSGFLALSGGPRILAMTPAAPITPPISAVEVTFDQPIQSASFTAADVVITGPGGPVPVTAVTLVTDNTWRITFASQSADGAYSVRIGPAIDELAANLHGLDQNGDGLSGDGANDTFAGTFTLDGTAPGIVAALGLNRGTRIGVTFSEPVAPAGATNPANYAVNGTAPSSVTLGSDSRSVALTVPSLTGVSFSLAVQNLADLLGTSADRTFTGTLLPILDQDIGYAGNNPSLPGAALTFQGDDFDIEASGSDFYWNTYDAGHFAAEPRDGDFDVQTQITAMTAAETYTQAGLMWRESLDPDARRIYVAANHPDSGRTYWALIRWSAAAAGVEWPDSSRPTVPALPNIWLRLRRAGDQFTAFRSTDGTNWVEYAHVTAAFARTGWVGPASSARRNGSLVSASYRRFADRTPALVTQPQDQSVASGANATFGVTVRGLAPLSYQWQFNGVALPGATGSLLELPAVTPQRVGDYRVVITNPNGSATSQVARLIVDGTGLGGFEADLAPAPAGNNAITVSDWVKVGRLVAGLDVPFNSSEFTRADCAPRTNTALATLPLGDGRLSVADWTQAGRYAAGVDPLTPAGGPSGPGGLALTSSRAAKPAGANPRQIRLANAKAVAGQTLTVPVEWSTLGTENAIGFSIHFDPARLTWQHVALADTAPPALLQVNAAAAAAGAVGIVLARPVGEVFPAGSNPLLAVEFRASGQTGAATIGFGDTPVWREIADANAEVQNAEYIDGLIRIVQPGTLGADVRIDAAGLTLQLTGEPGERYRIETSTDLSQWSTLEEADAQATPVPILDNTGARDQQRFYRAVLVVP
jgi:regulation of enolase protein 1 (concanavalin A-like superfamily)